LFEFACEQSTITCSRNPLAQHRAARFDVLGVVVRTVLAAAQDHVRVVVAARLEDRGHAHLRHSHERMARARGDDRVGRDLHAAVGAVLEADRAAQARCELTMALALGGARADGAPRDQVRDVLRAQQVEEFGRRRQAERVDVEQQLSRRAQPFVDAEAAVQTRIVDVALPADRRARLLEVHAHRDQQIVLQRVGGGLQAARVLERLVVVVDRARADDDQQPVVAAVQDVADRAPRVLDERRVPAGTGSSSCSSAGEISGRTAPMRTSSMRVVSCVASALPTSRSWRDCRGYAWKFSAVHPK
jgi:hypothetical protein